MLEIRFRFIKRTFTTLSSIDKFKSLAFHYTPNPSRAHEKLSYDEKSRKGEKARIKTLPKIAQKLWVKTYDSALEKYQNKGTAAAVAWSTVKKECSKDYNGVWHCDKLIESHKMKRRVSKLRTEAKKAAKEERAGTESGDRYKRQRVVEKSPQSEEEIARRIRHLRS